jgi:hypothetical protein
MLKTEVMRQKIVFLFFITIVLMFSRCSSIEKGLIPTYNNGGYKIIRNHTISTNDSDEINITGKVLDLSTGKPIDYATIAFMCVETKVSSKGEYSFKTKKSTYENFFITAYAIGYKKIETNFIDFNNNNNIEVNFYLSEDDKPFIDCERGIIKN